MPSVESYRWYVDRLARMSAQEVVHRVIERGRRFVDSRQSRSWDEFGDFDTAMAPLGLLTLDRIADEPLAGRIPAAARDAREGRFAFLGLAWPRSIAPAAAGTELWVLDPATGKHWPGAGTPAVKVQYRHARDFGDVKYVWEVNRLQFLPAMALSGRLGMPDAPDLVAAVLQSWMTANPPYDGINWTNGIEVALRIVSVLVAAEALDEAGRAALEPTLARFVDAHCRYLLRYPSLFSSSNNHRVAELGGILFAAASFPGAPWAGEGVDHALAELEAETLRQFHADGVGVEQSPTYAAFSLEWFVLSGVVADALDRPFGEAARERLASAARHLLALMDEDGRVPWIGDNDEGRVICIGQAPEPRYCASVAALTARWLDDAGLMPPAGDPELRDLVRPGLAASGSGAEHGLVVHRDGGYTVIRDETPLGTSVLVFDHGPLGFLSIAAHGHADALAVWWSVGRQPVIVDAGTYRYHSGGRDRDRYRGTARHNTVELGGRDQSVIVGPFAWKKHAAITAFERDGDTVSARHDGYRSTFGVEHARSLERLGPGTFAVTDTLVGAPPQGGLPWRMVFTLHPDVEPAADGVIVHLRVAGRAIGWIRRDDAGSGWTVEAAVCSPTFNVERPTRALVLTGTAASADAELARISFGVDAGMVAP